jgi:hypothetical protein
MIATMTITETFLFYLLVGAVVAVAMYLSDDGGSRQVMFLLPTAVLFWPLYLPVLLSGPAKRVEVVRQPVKVDEMTTAIAQVELELQTAMASLDGWPETALAREKDRIGELRGALTVQAGRIRELDELLSHSTAAEDIDMSPTSVDGANVSALDRWQKSQRAREQNFTRLGAVRRRSHADLMATLAWIRELVSMIHLAKFTGAPPSRTEELVAQIAAAVEGVSRVGELEEVTANEEASSFAINEPKSISLS